MIPTLVLFSTNMTMPHEALKWCFLEKCMCSSHTLQVLASARLCLYRITLALHCGKKRVDRTINLCTLGNVSLFPHGWLKECYFWIIMWGWNVTFKEHTQSDLYLLWTIIFLKYQKYLEFFFNFSFLWRLRWLGFGLVLFGCVLCTSGIVGNVVVFQTGWLCSPAVCPRLAWDSVPALTFEVLG